MMDFSWMSNKQYLAQVGHSLGGFSIVYVMGAFGGHTVMWWTLGLLSLAAALKEFIFDTSVLGFGEGDSWSDSLMDFCFWILGSQVGMVMFWISVFFQVSFH